ncbi:MAG: hypothetical protein ACF788_01990 [Novipirellula sp. JB048]
MQRQSQAQLTAAIAMTLVVTLGTSVGCVSLQHDLAKHCYLDKFRASKESYYHCSHCGQIVANPKAKGCPNCAYVKPYYGYEPTCWNAFPAGWGCPSGAQVSHPGMLEVMPHAEVIEDVPLEQTPMDDSVLLKELAPDEHATPSASDRDVFVALDDAHNTPLLDTAAKQELPAVPAQTEAPVLSRGMIETTANAARRLERELASSDAASNDAASSELTASGPVASEPAADLANDTGFGLSSAMPTTAATVDPSSSQPPEFEKEEFEKVEFEKTEFEKVKRVALPDPKAEPLATTISSEPTPAIAQEPTPGTPAPAVAIDVPSELDVPSQQWARIVTMPAQPVTESQVPSPSLIPSLTTLPKRVPRIPSEPATSEPASGVSASSKSDAPLNEIAPVRRLPVPPQRELVESQPTAKPHRIAGAQIESGLYPSPANRIQISSER